MINHFILGTFGFYSSINSISLGFSRPFIMTLFFYQKIGSNTCFLYFLKGWVMNTDVFNYVVISVMFSMLICVGMSSYVPDVSNTFNLCCISIPTTAIHYISMVWSMTRCQFVNLFCCFHVSNIFLSTHWSHSFIFPSLCLTYQEYK